MKALAPNTLLQNRYLVVQLIGKGGMGEVYLAVDQRLGSATALKRTFFSDDEMLGHAFEREARTLARLRHPVLPKVSDHFIENDTQYLAMEHISGDDLSKRLEISAKPFPLSWVLFWSDQLLDALAYLHAHEPPIVHRDIKPQNLKLTDENHIVLLDFGLAKNSIGNTRVTSTGGSIVGYTPHYAPMEQIRGTGTNPRSDLYSLSATVYQLLTNIVPPDALTRADSVLNGMADPTQPLNVLNPEIPKVISDVILKGMSLSMEQRYRDAREMQKALREAYAGIQNSMSAQTVAFNKSEVESQLPQSQQKTESFAPVSNAVAPPAQNYQSTAQPEQFSPVSKTVEPNDFEVMAKDNGQDFGFKTEVLPREKMPRPEDYAPPQTDNFAASVPSEQNFKTDNFAKTGDFSSQPNDDFEDFSEEKSFDPNVTSPLINFDKQDISPSPSDNYDSSDNRQNTFIPSALPPETEARNFAQAESSAVRPDKFSPAVAAQSTTDKKSNGKTMLVVGAVLAFAVLTVSAAALGWYVMKPSETTTVATPTPQTEPSAIPTLAPTPEPTLQADTNANTNTNSGADESANTNTVETTPEITSNPTQETAPTAKKQTVETGVSGRPQNDRVAQTKTPRQNQPRVNSPATNNRPQTPPKVSTPKSDAGGIYQ